ncbi:hypothetical protein FA95DRAFT_1298106 [Auriscalpium vulgare]|uniref:Uncharacterized protein n=1 Tax=Auriscalpium vulgare TaxID=40419 RepID=A0ACB8R2H9_9AGAM|nr:hypothetical protein FA95DRAFT_1298106 [Auriscalpium vulgare]
MAIIPLELQVLVVEWVYRHSQHRIDIDYNTLLACALVCRAWRPIAQHFLFRRVPRQKHVDESRPYISLLADILRACPHLAAHVRTIYLKLDPDPFDVPLLELCPHVAGVISGHAVDAYFMFRIRELAISQDIKYFSVIGVYEDVAGIWSMWPTLRAVDIVRFVSMEGPPVRLPSGVTSLSFPPAVMSRIFSTTHDLPALRDLELFGTEFPSDHLCASDLLPQLRTLVVHGPLPPAEVLEQLKQLESLVFNDLPVHNVSLPRTLRHVGYHCPSAPGPSTKDASFLVAALHGLDDIELVTVTRLNLLAKTQAVLREACRDMDVEFVTYQTSFHFSRPRCVDWI